VAPFRHATGPRSNAWRANHSSSPRRTYPTAIWSFAIYPTFHDNFYLNLFSECLILCFILKCSLHAFHKNYKLFSRPESASELYRPNDRSFLSKLLPTFADRGSHVGSVTDPYGLILGFLDRSRYFFFQVAPQLYSRGSVDPVPDPLLLRKSGSVGNRTPDLWISSQEL
jgi:hypothetical protein